RSGATFEVSDGTVYYALAALKGVGAQAVDLIVEARKDGLFTSLADFAARVNPRAINKRVIESLAAAGAFDALDSNRARVFAGAEAILAACQRSHEAATMGQNDMFGGAADAPTIMLPSDPTGHFEAVLFSEGLAQYRDVLEPGAAVLLQLGAELQGEDVRARVLHAEPLDDAAAKTQRGLRIFVRDTRPLESIAKRLQLPERVQGAPVRAAAAKSTATNGSDGDVSLIMMLDLETEVELKLP